MLLISIGLTALATALCSTPAKKAERLAVVLTALGLLPSLAGVLLPANGQAAYGVGFYPHTHFMAFVIGLVSLMVQGYSLRHFDGWRHQRRAFQLLNSLTLCLLVYATADHLLLMGGGLLLSNILLARLMSLNQKWKAAEQSAWMALSYTGAGSALFVLASLLTWQAYGHFSLEALGQSVHFTATSPIIAGLLVAAALAQSAIWPFHRWLIASANAPTPVSAFMHAGLVNGGAIILFKTLPLTAQFSWTAPLLIALGLGTALLGTFWMLVQTDVKRTLTCSTMGQMGFMVLQCGLGLYPAALAHMVWHGFFKASLFLSAGSAIKAAPNAALALKGPKSPLVFLFGLACGTLATGVFITATQTWGMSHTTYALLWLCCGITSAHMAMAIWQTKPSLKRALLALGLTLGGALAYGASVSLAKASFPTIEAPAMSPVYWAIGLALLLGWALSLFREQLPGAPQARHWLYARALIYSQPDAASKTLYRSQYRP